MRNKLLIILITVLVLVGMTGNVVAERGGGVGNGGVGHVSSGGAGVEGHLWLQPVDGVYVNNSPDDWINESWVTGFGEKIINISNQDPDEDVHHIYILTAVNMSPSANGITVILNGEIITGWTLVPSNGYKPQVPTIPVFDYPNHGIFQPGVWYNITRFEIPLIRNGGNYLMPINTTSSNPNAKIHFDGVGADSNNKAIVFVPPSHDVTTLVPEFPTIALPIAAVIGLVFFFQNKKKKEE